MLYPAKVGCIALKTILLINDDGIYSSGLMAIKTKLDKHGNVVVVTPKEETSGVGKAITASNCVTIEEIFLSDGSRAYVIDGTPADAYLLGVNKILKRSPDLVVAGINLGPNLGIDDFLNSGTIGAALEAAIHGVPALAVSYCKREISDQKADKSTISLNELEFTASVGERVAVSVLEKGMPSDVDLLSVNVPEVADCSKMKITRLSYVGYGDLFTEDDGSYRIVSWNLDEYVDSNPDTDVHVVRDEGCISITPVKVRLQHNLKAIEHTFNDLFQC